MSLSPTFSFLFWAWLTNAPMPQPLSVFSCVVKAKFNRPNSAFDHFEVLDLLQALVHLTRMQAHQTAEEYAAALDEVRASWDLLNYSA